MKTFKLLTAAALAGLLATTAMAGNNFIEMDPNKDGKVTAEEMRMVPDRQARFDAYDKNRDGVVDADEFSDGQFSYYDRDGDGDLSEEERAAYADDGKRRPILDN